MEEFDYNTKYYEGLLENCAGTSGLIAKIRWNFVAEAHAQTVLDYGCGCNFMTIFAPDGIIIDSYDIGHIGNSPYPQTGINRDHYDLILFHDVLEHVDWVDAPDAMIEDALCKTAWVTVTVPVLPSDVPLVGWRHYKPGEHLTYFSEESLDAFFTARGFIKVRSDYPECPPRLDILSALYRKEQEFLRAPQQSSTSSFNSSVSGARKVSEV